MEYFIIEPITKNIVFSGNETTATTRLLYFLFEMQIRKNKNFKIKYKYNYSDVQTIEIVDKTNNYLHRFTNVPTICGIIDDEKIKRNIMEFYKNVYNPKMEGGE